METYIASVQEQIDDFNQHACDVLRHEKKIRGWTNKHIANISGVSEDAVKYLLSTEKPPKDPRTFPMIRIAKAMGLDLNYLFGYTPPQIADTSVVTAKEDYYVSDIIMLSDKRVEDVKAMCELRLKDKDEMYERIIAELKGKKEISPYVTLD
jgi:hypothetical protein